MTDNDLIEQLSAARWLAERFNIDFEQILDNTLRRLPPDLINAVCAKLELPSRSSASEPSCIKRSLQALSVATQRARIDF
jgi:hypothetical protein